MTDEIPEGGQPRTLGEDPPWGRLVLGYLSEGRDRRLRIFARDDATFVPVEEVYGAYVCWWEDGEDDADWVEASEIAAVRQAHGGDDVKVLPGEWRTAWAPGAFSCLAFAEEDAPRPAPGSPVSGPPTPTDAGSPQTGSERPVSGGAGTPAFEALPDARIRSGTDDIVADGEPPGKDQRSVRACLIMIVCIGVAHRPA